ncbi:bifunctional methylenetetrahydrofolate dehydrogenase/methenyltetrahydrofolate cyclohydrolase [Lactobacillus kullabergensis]|uniref:bifunctional 5,10-methylenetetrahydrofolate dehydrogenase/5,10-methenyltetrahydrofolate cyclohydrolase n=1 Tax=Lactobacillus TaxID=1578 RepID=UPI0022482592|nr:tetrahydrofolate dehydrogenase/cyclohydrolase catalytic domain-containing protein [Lactobacillus kullabergensis]MCX0290321.1 bifunctional methylenetetrahydrofolate dehydrogenase/methenyltetrahydrofolate cyclohydrolase [Lactobacillus kullabergensis]
MGQLLDGKKLANIRADILQKQVLNLKKSKIQPLFCVINIGQDPSSQIYLKTKKRRADQIGIEQKLFQLPATVSQKELLELIDKLNHDKNVNGIMIQLPVPKQIILNEALAAIDPEKDVDCLTPTNIGRLWQGDHFVEPATAHGILALLDHYHISLKGKNAVIIGRSSIVGKPLAALMLERDATVSILHLKTKNLAEYTKRADILVSATGQPKLIKANMIKKNAVIVDVGICRVNGNIVGDVDFAKVVAIASFITPVPGGVGPLTVESLMEQVVQLTRRNNGKQ